MKLSIQDSANYCAVIVTLKSFINLEGCDNIQGTQLLGNHVIVGKDAQIGDIGIFFPVECKIGEAFLSLNNLYDKSNVDMNVNKAKFGFFSKKGRVRAVRLRGFRSEGFFIPLKSLNNLFGDLDLNEFKEGDSFDTIDEIQICQKYRISTRNAGSGSKNEKKSKTYISRIIDTQFRFHTDTSMLGKNLNKIHLDDSIQISYKVHGTSFIASRILCNRELTWFDKLLKKFGVNIETTYYDNIYSSRKVIKNEDLTKFKTGYYSEDIWGIVNKEIEHLIPNGVTLYGEIVGFLSDNKQIQKDYDYGCKPGEHDIYIYRITYTNVDGKVFEFSAKQVQQWCLAAGIKAVPELFYGTVEQYIDKNWTKMSKAPEDCGELFLEIISKEFLEGDCYICKNKVPAEGVVIRLEKLDIECYKAKSFAFYERETKALDKEEVDIEEEQNVGA
jgi:hypothetical protein